MYKSKNLIDFYEKYPLIKINVGGKEWEYIVRGKGKQTFLLFPGGAQTAESNCGYIDAFKNEYKVIVPTIYNVDSLQEFDTAINTILQKEQVQKVVVYGLSLGGVLAQTYTRNNKDKVKALIISHAFAPKSKTFLRKVLFPLHLLNLVLPFIPNSLMRVIIKFRFATRIQGTSTAMISKYKDKTPKENKDLFALLSKKYYAEFFTKRLLQSWIYLYNDFSKLKFTAEDFAFLGKNILILRTDNDPLAQDGGEFAKIYPKATVYTFYDTGHLTFHYQFIDMIKIIKSFLNKK